MKEFLIYLLYVSICQLGFYVLYILFFKNLKFFQFNRIYLLLSVVFSFIIPVLEIPVWTSSLSDISKLAANIQLNFNQPLTTNTTEPAITTEGISAITLLSIIYFIGALTLLIGFIFSMVSVIIIKIKSSSFKEGNIRYILTTKAKPVFTFLKWVYLHPELKKSVSTSDYDSILCHEKSHVNHLHSLDNILMEIAKCIIWFNPVIWLIKHELNHVHEYQADQSTLKKGEAGNYASLLLSFSQKSSYRNNIVHPFMNIKVKRRISMLTKSNSSRSSLIRYAAILPLVLLLLSTFSFKEITTTPEVSLPPGQNDLIVGNITWDGNTVYSDQELNEALELNSGDKYDEKVLENRLGLSNFFTEEDINISSKYMDHGYLFFQIGYKPVKNGNQVDVEISIFEGKETRVNEVRVMGNENVSTEEILEMIDIHKDELFSRKKLTEANESLFTSGYFQIEELQINPMPLMIASETREQSYVDLEFYVVEK